MRILVISQHYYPENFRITDICETLVEMGHDVTVICGYPNYPEGSFYVGYRSKAERKAHKDEIINGVRLYRCFEIPRGHNAVKLFLNYYSVCLSMKRKAKNIKKRFDCVFVNETSPIMVGWAGIAYSKKASVPCFLYCYDLWPASLAAGGIKEKSIIYRFFNHVSRKIYTRVNHIFITSKSFFDYLHDIHGVDESSISYLPQYCEDLFGDVRDEPHVGYNFVFAGNIGKMQSVETIIRAAAIIEDNGNVRFHIVGDGSDYAACRSLASKLNTNNVFFYGRRPINEMSHFYAMADAMLISLKHDELISKTLPGKIQSYMAAGKPIIASIDGETRRVIEEAKCGFVCDSENYADFAECLVSFLNLDEKNKHQMQERSRNFYLSHFSKKVFMERLIGLMDKTIASH